jgi:hypothetical protein
MKIPNVSILKKEISLEESTDGWSQMVPSVLHLTMAATLHKTLNFSKPVYS